MATNPSADKNKPGSAAAGHSFLRNDFPAIRNATLLFAFTVLLGGALVFGTQTLLDRQQNALNAAQADENRSHDSYRLAEIEKGEIHDFQPKYLQLVREGFIGSEKRLDWIDSIAAIQKKATLAPVLYDISEQAPFAVDPQIDTGTLELHGSTMHFKMNLLHEADLLRFLTGLGSGQVYDMQNCVIKRWPELDPASAGELAPRLQAECSLIWITLGKHVDAVADPGSPQPILPGP